jgi:hypothetical protein
MKLTTVQALLSKCSSWRLWKASALEKNREALLETVPNALGRFFSKTLL